MHLRIARAVYTMHPESFEDLMYPLIFYPLSSNHMRVVRNRCIKIKHSESLKKMRATRCNSFASKDARNGCKEIAWKLRRVVAA